MKFNRWQLAWGLFTLLWLAYWIRVTWNMNFDAGDLPFVLRVVVLPPIVLYAGGWLVARLIRLFRVRHKH